MKRLLILGGGTAGTIMANKMRKRLPVGEWNVTVIEKEKDHFYQPGFLFIPFGYYSRNDIVKPVRKFIPAGIDLLCNEVERIATDENNVFLKDGTQFAYDILIIATGARISPEDTPGLRGELWKKKICLSNCYIIKSLNPRTLTSFWPGQKIL